MRSVLTIAASDSSCGAGVQADLAVFRELGVYGLCAVTNVTAQNSRGVHKIAKVAPNVITAQIDAAARDFEVAACKIGMLFFPRAVDVVAERIRRREIPKVVLDPVITAKNGETLLTEPAIKRMKRALIPVSTLVTPNYSEASVLTGNEVRDTCSAREAARALVEMGAANALVKGGHAVGEPVDVLYDGECFHEFAGERIDKRMHGTGCVLSAAIAARLALGDDVPTAVRFAKHYVADAIGRSAAMGKADMNYFVGGRE